MAVDAPADRPWLAPAEAADAVVGRRPLGGARGSGTSDKSASTCALARWASPLTVKDTILPERRVPFPQA